MKKYTEKDFIDIIRKDITPLSKEDFRQTPYMNNLWDKMKDDDIRKQHFKNVGEFYDFYYDFLMNDKPLKDFFNKRLSFIDRKPLVPIDIKDGWLNNKPNNSRFLRNINLPSILDVLSMEGNSFKSFYKGALEQGKNITPITMPSSFKKSIRNDYDTFVVSMKTKTGMPSIFSPSVYNSILKYIEQYSVPETEVKMLIPTASWGSPILATEHSKYKKLHILDVQQDVLSVCTDLFEYINQDKNVLFDDASYEMKTFCSPSEKMSNIVDNDYNIIFFCPPYYDLEIYGGSDEQSTDLYGSYEEWLNGYWRATVNEAYKVLETKGIYSFTIGKLIRGYDMAEDLLEIAKEKFELIDEIKIAQIPEKTRASNVNDKYEICYIMKKK